MRQEVQHLNQVRADLKDKVQLQSQEQTRTVSHARACEQQHVAAVDRMELLQQKYQEVLAVNKQHEVRVTSLTHAFNAYAETQDEEMDGLRAMHSLQLRTLESKYDKSAQMLTTETDSAWTKRMNATVEVWKQRCAAKDDKISKLKNDLHQVRTLLAQSSAKLPVPESQRTRTTRNSKVSVSAAAAITTPMGSNQNGSTTMFLFNTTTGHNESSQHPSANASREEMCELVETITAPIPEFGGPQDVLNKVRTGFIYFLEEHYHALDAYETERRCWHTRLLALDDASTADTNPQRDLVMFLRDQVVVVHEKARRELASLHHALDSLFQLWIARPGDLTDRETRSLSFMLSVIAKTNPRSHIAETDVHSEVDEKCREGKNAIS